jgi:putative serine protease PepD
VSDTENPGQHPDDLTAGAPGSPSGDEPTTPVPPVPATPVPPWAGEPAAAEPTAPQPGWTAPQPPPSYGAPQVPYGAPQPPAYGAPQPVGAWGPPMPPYVPQPAGAFPPAQQPARARVSGWTWPLVAVLALLLGLGGGFVGGKLATNDDDNGSGGVLSVQRRTAQPLSNDNESIAKVAQEVLPSTVQIVAEYKGQAQGAVGSGFVLDKQGHVITNNHVVEEAASDHGPIDVIDENGNHHKATVVGRSPVYDLAVLKVAGAEKLKPAALGSADQMRVGESVVAAGSPLRYSASVTSGIISAKNRPVTTGEGANASYINALQTDAAINPGNSGGPLANLQGQVIGVNSALASLSGGSSSTDEAGNIGIGFAIPIEQVQITADQILRTGKAQYPVIGVSIGDAKALDGALVKKIDAGTPAAKSDLKVGDEITAVDGTKVSGVIDVIVAIRAHQVSDTVQLSVKRGGKTLTIPVGLFGKTG